LSFTILYYTFGCAEKSMVLLEQVLGQTYPKVELDDSMLLLFI